MEAAPVSSPSTLSHKEPPGPQVDTQPHIPAPSVAPERILAWLPAVRTAYGQMLAMA